MKEYREDYASSIDYTNFRINTVSERDVHRLIEANTKRGDAWKDIGLLGIFLEIRTMYLRLRGLVWDKHLTTPHCHELSEWQGQVDNALQDLRNYCVLAQLALEDNNFKGAGADGQLKLLEEICQELKLK